MGVAVHRKMAESAHGEGGGNHDGAKLRHAARRRSHPILANLFLHYAFDFWRTRTHPDLPWCRYADDGLVHAVASKKQKPSRRSSKRVWRNAVWRCTRRKPKSSTAKTRSAEASTRMSSLISSG